MGAEGCPARGRHSHPICPFGALGVSPDVGIVTTMNPALCLLALVASAACGATEEIRGKDRSELLPAVHARMMFRPTEVTGGLRFASGLEVGATTNRGDFSRSDGPVSYASDVGTVHAVLGTVSSQIELLGLVGGAYADHEIDSEQSSVRVSSLGVSGGFEVGVRPWQLLGPYARYTVARGSEWQVDRLEVGIDVRIEEWLGLRVGYSNQVMQDEYLSLQEFRVETDGVHLGMMLRF